MVVLPRRFLSHRLAWTCSRVSTRCVGGASTASSHRPVKRLSVRTLRRSRCSLTWSGRSKRSKARDVLAPLRSRLSGRVTRASGSLTCLQCIGYRALYDMCRLLPMRSLPRTVLSRSPVAVQALAGARPVASDRCLAVLCYNVDRG